jgi:hypothetical protein
MASMARTEAKALLVIARRSGDTTESLRELIAEPPEIKTLLRAYTSPLAQIFRFLFGRIDLECRDGPDFGSQGP